MSQLIKLPSSIINLEYVRQIEFEEDPPLTKITWSTGDEATLLRVDDALALMEAVDKLVAVDVSMPHPLEQVEVE